MIRKIVNRKIFVFGLCLWGMPAIAECNPAIFAAKDIKRLQFSSSLWISAMSLLEEPEKGDAIDVSMIVKGPPITVSLKDAKSLAQYVQSLSGVEFSQEESLSHVKSALSSVDPDVRKACRAAQSIIIEVPNSAFTAPTFLTKISWTPTETNPPQNAQATILTSGAKINGVTNNFVINIENKGEVSLPIERELGSPVAISVSINNKIEIVYLPPKISQKVELSVRKSPNFSAVTDNGVYSGARKEDKPCVDAQEGMLLLSTFVDNYKRSGNLGTEFEFRWPLEGSTPKHACALVALKQLPANSSARNSIDGNFTILEAVPAK